MNAGHCPTINRHPSHGTVILPKETYAIGNEVAMAVGYIDISDSRKCCFRIEATFVI